MTDQLEYRSGGEFQLSGLDDLVAQKNGYIQYNKNNYIGVIALFSDKTSGNTICEGEINNCVKVVKDYYCNNPLTPCTGDEILSYQYKFEYFDFGNP